MLSLDDPRWVNLCGGYRVPFDPRPLFLQIECDPSPKNWAELTEELFHQGDVGEASYAAVPQIVRIVLNQSAPIPEALILVTMIEWARHSGNNPQLPEWLRQEYEEAIGLLARETLTRFSRLTSADQIRSALGVLAVWKGQLSCAYAAVLYSDHELKQILESG